MSKTFTLTITCDNAAFEDDGLRPELACILRVVANTLGIGNEGVCHDVNGNTVGTWRIA